MMLVVPLILVTLSFGKKCSEYMKMYEVDTIDGAFECINSIKTDKTQNTELVDSLKEYLEMYAFKDILRQPPQPSFNNSYYPSVDIDAELDDVDVNTTILYDFFTSIASIITSTRDLHLGFKIYYDSTKANKELLNFYYVLPFAISISDDKKMYLIPQELPKSVQSIIPQTVKDNKNISIKTINGQDPFEIIRIFGFKYCALKCPQAQFTLAKTSIAFGNLANSPLSSSYLKTQFEVVWENGDTEVMGYSILRFYLSSDLSSRAKRNLLERFSGGIRSPLQPEDIFDSVFLKKLKNRKNSFKGLVDADGIVSCSVSSTKKVNSFILKSFSPRNRNSFDETISNCVDLFDENDYPIQIILPLNGGGIVYLQQNIEHIFSPHNDVNLIVSARISNKTEMFAKSVYGTLLEDPITCEKREKSNNVNNLGEWYTNNKVIKYGDVEHKITQPSLLAEEIWIEKRLSKHIRKPTEIVVYTDSFCYSACSMLTKGLKERGSAIITGFSGDPNGKDSEFEVGLSPTTVLSMSGFLKKNYNPFYKYGYDLSVSFLESFRFNYDYNETIPREFLTDMVDERINIFAFSENEIDKFADKTLAIVKKYETQCNPNNKRLVKEDGDCDGQITIEHARGGYICGDDGKWTKTCVASYCVDGYAFDYYNQKCVEIKCGEKLEDGSNSSSITHILMFSILLLILLV